MLHFYFNKNLIFLIESKFFPILSYKSQVKITPHYSVKTVANLSYRIYGEAAKDGDQSPILLLHGLLGCKKHWDSIGKTMMNVTKRSVLSVDLRNHGDSPHINSHKYEDLTADILKLYEKLNIEKAYLVGHSMGGRASMSVSLLAPPKVAGLLVIDISPTSTARDFSEGFPTILAAMKKINFKKHKSIKEAKEDTRKELESTINNELLLKAVLSNVKMKSDHTIGWACNLDILIRHFKYISSFPKSLRKKTYYGPTLFIGGQLSDYLPPDDLPSIREMFPRAVITYIPQTGHNIHVEDPKTFLELVIAFMKSQE
ncbi:unnamed protein product [Danaus chrysippus]|uniref:sn-1-specific diacylglycerol lipase ABHD11 n=1 Tax=Danaus chrysippus TaxID=151541 RepID=A0A8J2VPT6_9NEOP|nr:unnamed protein product [Danaus chrysippus]